MSQNLSVCIIGAGAAGLCAIKNSVDHGLNVNAFELSKNIGGTWVYTDEIGMDKYGNDIHSSMYKDLVTNIPKEIMGYPDLPFIDREDSYITSKDVLNYYNWYAKKFDLMKYIRFEHNILRVRPMPSKIWEVVVMDLPSRECKVLYFDAVMVCNGHQNTPKIPNIVGRETFGGKQIHSHDFRQADDFKGERVCLIGGGPSASEMVTLISKVADHVTWAHHSNRPSLPRFYGSVEQKPDVQSISVESVTFVDGTTQHFNVIIYATGYLYTFPFLSIDCGLSIVDDIVRPPLYKYCIASHHPTLAFIGLLNLICPNTLFDFQIKLFLKFLTGQKQLPSKEDMLRERETSEFQEVGVLDIRKFPMDISIHLRYLEAIANEAGIGPVKPVIAQLCEKAFSNIVHNASGFRAVKFRIVDDDHYYENENAL